MRRNVRVSVRHNIKVARFYRTVIKNPYNENTQHQTDTACSWLVCHSRGDCSGEHCANCIHLPRLSGGPASQFFGEASRAFPQHGWRSAYSLRETLSPTQDQGQHSRPLHTHTPNLTKFTDSLIQPPRPCPPPLSIVHPPPKTPTHTSSPPAPTLTPYTLDQIQPVRPYSPLISPPHKLPHVPTPAHSHTHNKQTKKQN